MPYAVVPPIVIMVGAFTVGGLGLGLGNYLKYDGIRVRLCIFYKRVISYRKNVVDWKIGII